jgi:hypothetical protein
LLSYSQRFSDNEASSSKGKAHSSMTLNGYLYASPSIQERLAQEASLSEAEHKARAEVEIARFDREFEGRR